MTPRQPQERMLMGQAIALAILLFEHHAYEAGAQKDIRSRIEYNRAARCLRQAKNGTMFETMCRRKR